MTVEALKALLAAGAGHPKERGGSAGYDHLPGYLVKVLGDMRVGSRRVWRRVQVPERVVERGWRREGVLLLLHPGGLRGLLVVHGL